MAGKNEVGVWVTAVGQVPRLGLGNGRFLIRLYSHRNGRCWVSQRAAVQRFNNFAQGGQPKGWSGGPPNIPCR